MKLNLKSVAVCFLAVSIVMPVFAQTTGPEIYKSKCAMCHGADGLGATPAGKAMKAASFKDPAIVKASDAEMLAIAKSGKNKMPAYAGKYTDAQLKATITYIRTLQK